MQRKDRLSRTKVKYREPPSLFEQACFYCEYLQIMLTWACFVTIGFCFKVVRVSLATTVDKTLAFSSAAVVIISWKISSA